MGIRRTLAATAAFALCFASRLVGAAVSEPSTGVTVSVTEDGHYSVSTIRPEWSFEGDLGTPATGIEVRTGSDNAGPYREIAFSFGATGEFSGSIRTWLHRPVVLFGFRSENEAANVNRFPVFSRYPDLPGRLSYIGIFATYVFSYLEPESPWIWFDRAGNAFVLSAASRFMVSATSLGPAGLATGVNSKIPTLPAGFDQQTILVIEDGINKAFDTWGNALTDLSGKIRPGNDADATLHSLGYWTDNGGTYYYRFDERRGYAGTLLAIRDEFAAKGVPLGYVQLDSWFYPKGPQQDWTKSDRGIYRYVADPKLFPRTLAGFRDDLGLPVVTHARWIDPESPYRSEYRTSGGVATDERYWERIASYLSESGVSTYEQDWLGTNAKTELNLLDARTFLDNMATAMARKGITMQYCMATPLHFLQSVRFDNLTTIRASEDRFSRGRWDAFLYASRLASALGVWPWADVFMSAETDNLLIATLSAGPVGVGDSLGNVDAANLRKAVRADGVIVKPDLPLAPSDDTFRNDSERLGRPMVASTYTDYAGHRTHFVFAYPRGADTAFSVTPSTLGMTGEVYALDWFSREGQMIDAAQPWKREIAGDRDYLVFAPVGPSGIAFLGDLDHFVPVGRKRIADLRDDGSVEAGIVFAAGEASRTVHGWSRNSVRARALEGKIELIARQTNGRFWIKVQPGPMGTARIRIE